MTHLGALLWCGLAAFLAGVVWRIYLWSRGRPASLSLVDVLNIPQRYLKNVHDVVVRDPLAARMHMAAASGYLSTLGLAFIFHGFGVQPAWVGYALVGGCALLILGGAIALVRRSGPRRARRLSGGAYDFVAPALIGLGLFVGVSTLDALGAFQIDWQSPWGLILLMAGAAAIAFLFPGMTLGPMRHVLAGALHLAFHPRPERFDGRVSRPGLKFIDLDAAPLGVQRPADFTWKQLLSFDACVQCGRCEDVCPAYAAGAPLSPKKLIHDLWAQSVDQSGSEISDTTGAAIPEETLYACTTCAACVESCPMLIEHVDAVVDLRRNQILVSGQGPGKVTDVLANLRETDTASGKDLRQRHDWASNLSPRILLPGDRAEILLLLGEAAFEPHGRKSLASLMRIYRMANVDVAILGDRELDCGDTARRLGDEAQFQRLARATIETLRGVEFKTIVTPDPHVFNVIKNEYPDLDGTFEVQHASTHLLELIRNAALPVKAESRRMTYHDPCYLGRYNREFDSPRALLEACGVELVEMERSRERSFCCGWGGGAAIADIASRERISDLRAREARDTAVEALAVACPNCALMLGSSMGDSMPVLDVIEVVLSAAEAADQRGLSQLALT